MWKVCPEVGGPVQFPGFNAQTLFRHPGSARTHVTPMVTVWMENVTVLSGLMVTIVIIYQVSFHEQTSECNKTDLQLLEGIAEDDKKLVEEMKLEALKTLIDQGGEVRDGAEVLLTMSTLMKDGVINVKNAFGCGSSRTNTIQVGWDEEENSVVYIFYILFDTC
uniref:Nucleolar GTP-binding protein 1-like n=1 Tax=Tanacetum cinerariifolium TaxID=118510 RepID=A0A6L2J1Z0_TANCI|nr:nucleolar GTP-binding protein 1-like [Tanacetum cinerariifolium]